MLAATRRTDADEPGRVLREALTFLGMMEDTGEPNVAEAQADLQQAILQTQNDGQHAIRQAQAFRNILQPVPTEVRVEPLTKLVEQPHVLRPFEGGCKHSVRTAGSASSSTPL